jgi:glucan-binding YG repeat protein
VSVNNDCTLIVSGGTITGVQSDGVYGSESTVTIIGGTISGEGYDIYSDDCTITLSVGENGVGATFLDGMEVSGTTLNAILGEDAAYWQGNKMIVPADGATSITGGDVVIKAPCTHSGDLIDSEYYSNEFHQKTCGCGFINELEEHRFGADSVCEDCGYDKNTITITMTDDWGDSWNGNGIHVYKDGVLIGTVTLESGYTGTWSCPYDPDAEYEFYWQRGNYPEECSFEISIACETVKKVSGKVCSRYIDGQLLYPLPLYSGWIEMDGKWYYYDPETNEPVTGVVRVPYPTEPINGITYGPNPEDVAYCESKGQTFVNKDTAWFWFNYDGSFKYNETGTWHVGIGNKSDNVFVVNGMIPWHVGMVATLGRHYYFIGDETNGANKYAVGDVYITRNTADRDFVIGGVYTFDEYGALCEYDGITEVNGVLRYYEDARLMAGNGLTKVGDNYIYVRSNGELAVDCKYYVPGNDLGIASGLYTFDENGFMVEPVSTDKNGVYFENGAWYYYENGKIGYNKGLINVSTNWHFEDGSVMGYTAFIYVRSSGKLATGDYYITNVSNGYGLFSAGQKVNFSEDGMAAAPKNGIHEIDGSLYYFVNNRIQYNAGLMEYNGGWIYVRSNGVLATGKYWITNTNGNLDAGMYEFGADGYMVITDTKDGIVNDNGVLHYYLDGKKRYGLGLIQLPEGTYIYVRTNGELAVGSYWITNHNGLLPAGMYEFSEDGILINN